MQPYRLTFWYSLPVSHLLARLRQSGDRWTKIRRRFHRWPLISCPYDSIIVVGKYWRWCWTPVATDAPSNRMMWLQLQENIITSLLQLQQSTALVKDLKYSTRLQSKWSEQCVLPGEMCHKMRASNFRVNHWRKNVTCHKNVLVTFDSIECNVFRLRNENRILFNKWNIDCRTLASWNDAGAITSVTFISVK